MNEEQKDVTVAIPEEAKSKNTKLIIIGVVVLVVVFLASKIFSPERAIENALENAGDGNYNVDMNDDGSINIQGDDGESMQMTTGKTATLPEKWPDSVPIAPNAQIEYSSSVSSGDSGTLSHSVVFSTSQSAAEVTEFYKSALEANGWTIGATVSTGEGSMLSASKGDDEAAVAYISEVDGKTSVNLTVQAE